MICQLCGKNQATVCLNIDMNGQRSVLFICDECAEERKLKANPSPALLLSIINEIKTKNGGEEIKQEIPDITCSACGRTYAEYIKTSLLGCPMCYKAFEDQLGALISHITKKTEGSEESTATAPVNHELLKLKLQLKRSIENEDYETAATLRDKIRDAEAGEIKENEECDNGEN